MTMSDLSRVRQPVEQARGLPNAHYTDPDMHAAELKRLFADEWCALCTEADIPRTGDAFPLTFAGEPLLALRGGDGVVRVFYNVCRHRGMILVESPRRIEGALRCPYHSWCYATTGRLVTTPHVGGPGQNTHPGLDRDRLGLIELRSHIWHGIVFVNLSGSAPPFDVRHADLLARWAEFAQPLHHGGPDSRFSLSVETNWKLAVENYCESYHLPWVHPGLNSYSRLEDHYNIESEGFSGQGTEVYRQLRDAEGGTFPDFAGLSPKWDKAAEYIALYPNLLLGVHRDHAFAILLHPDGPGRTREDVHLYYATADTDPDLRAANARQWRTVFEEDIFVVEGMQKGRAAQGFDGGRFAPAMDAPTHRLHAWVATRMAAG
ncbi:aromatic ring-hydroxylating oxygenase subunit alpha [Tropicimonas sp. S265A]|uniref:aromatic ring-hydroxylating oxygenase subunit alpha n=1 Tax=Tropicimonas sp. S265A TaxID=3415134 RepID=UPI003C7E9943